MKILLKMIEEMIAEVETMVVVKKDLLSIGINRQDPMIEMPQEQVVMIEADHQVIARINDHADTMTGHQEQTGRHLMIVLARTDLEVMIAPERTDREDTIAPGLIDRVDTTVQEQTVVVPMIVPERHDRVMKRNDGKKIN